MGWTLLQLTPIHCTEPMSSQQVSGTPYNRSHGMQRLRMCAVVGLLAIGAALTLHAQDLSTSRGAGSTDEPRSTPTARLTATAHPALPSNAAQYWLVPDLAAPRSTRSGATAAANLTKAVQAIADAKYVEALRLIDAPAIAATPDGA